MKSVKETYFGIDKTVSKEKIYAGFKRIEKSFLFDCFSIRISNLNTALVLIELRTRHNKIFSQKFNIGLLDFNTLPTFQTQNVS